VQDDDQLPKVLDFTPETVPAGAFPERWNACFVGFLLTFWKP
jgi:hypothetical protein